MSRRTILISASLIAAALVAGVSAFAYFGPVASFREIPRVPFNPEEARSALPSLPPPTTTTLPEPTETVIVIPNDRVDAFLLVGRDRGGPDGEARSDALQLVVRPRDANPIFIVPLPRNLELPDPCSGRTIKLKDALVGCGEQVSGPELLAILVEDFTGITVDHYVILNFSGFAGLVDALGGVEICVPYPVRDRTTGTGLDLPGGCTNATGEQALGWVTSRTTEGFVDGEWVALEGVSSLDRDRRILDLMFKFMAKAKRLRSPADLLAIADQLSGTFVLDEGLSVTDAVSLAWELRSTPLGDIVTFTIPTAPGASEEGEFVLSATEGFLTTLEREYPASASWRQPVQP